MIIDKFLDDVFLLKNNTFFDDRGFFFESFNSNFLEVTNIKNPFVQDNISFSKETRHYNVFMKMFKDVSPS